LGAALVGREEELGAVDAFFRRPGGALLLEGPAGIGKTVIWEAAVAKARARRLSVLVTRPSSEDAQLGFAGLADLLEDVDVAARRALPAPQRRALERALLLAEDDHAADVRALGAGVLAILSGLGSIVVAIDDVQWLDSATTNALAFAARRLHGGKARFLLTKRTPSGSSLETSLARAALERIALEPLSFGATMHMLHDRLGLTLARPSARRLYAAAHGNPLFALELGRAMSAQGGRVALGEEMPLPESVEALLAERIDGLAPDARRALIAVALSGDAKLLELDAVLGRDAIDAADRAGVVVVDGARIRAAHPLIGAVAQARADRRTLRELHGLLAGVAEDEEERSRHLALATPGEDAALADNVASAAAHAARRGAAATAAKLGAQALRLTPPGASQHPQRLLDAATYEYNAGEIEQVNALLAPALASLPAGVVRARALLLVAECSDEFGLHYYERALAESTDDASARADVLTRLARYVGVGLVERVAECEAWATEAVELAAANGLEAFEHAAVAARMWIRALRGLPLDHALTHDEGGKDIPTSVYDSAERIRGVQSMWRGELAPARQIFERLLELADLRGESESYFALRVQLCELELRTGACDTVAVLLDDWARHVEEAQGSSAAYLRCAAMLAAIRGLPEEAAALADDAAVAADLVAIRWHRLEARRARGIAALLAEDYATAADALRETWEHTRREGIDELGAFPVASDLVQALAGLGAIDEARKATAVVERLAAEQDHPWARATASRCRGLVLLAERDDAAAVDELRQAVEAYDRLGFPWDGARTLVALGVAQRRLKRRLEARRSLEEAVRSFDELGSAGWATHARAELARVGGRTTNDGLTPTEQRVAELVAQGLPNKEVAAALVVSVSAVEANLTRIYAKLGIRSRAELARDFAH
jgi:DNA-binding NarL/FixJ family response regulator